MGANCTQAQGLALFLIGFVFVAGGLAAGVIYAGIGLALVAVSVAMFIKCKPWEHQE